MDNYQYKLSLYYQHVPQMQALFKYMNGRINTINRCILNIQGYSNDNYAHFQYPNYVTLYLGSIINDVVEKYSDPELVHNWIMSLASVTLAHELYHADQDINNLQYTSNADYANNIEAAAEYNAEIFCASNRTRFKTQFSFDYLITKNSEFGTYNKNSIESFMINCIIGVFRNGYIGDQFAKLLKTKASDAYLIIKYHNTRKHTLELKVKENGQLISDPKLLRKFSDGLMKIRHGVSPTDYVMDVREVINPGLNNADGLMITIVKQNYDPILYT